MRPFFIILFSTLMFASISFAKPPIERFEELVTWKYSDSGDIIVTGDGCNGKFSCGGVCVSLVGEGESIQYQGTCQKEDTKIGPQTYRSECVCKGAFIAVDPD